MKHPLKYINYADESYLTEVLSLIEKFDTNGKIEVKSSGSTGPRKTFTFNRKQVEHSVHNTLKYFDLRPGDTVLLCLSMEYVAAKLMVLRAYLGELTLIIAPPSSDPFKRLTQEQEIQFAPLVPLQVKTALEHHSGRLSKIQKVLIGGGSLNENLRNALVQMSNDYYQSFGMAETLTHFALKELNEDYYQCLNGVEISQDDHGNAVVHAPQITGKDSLKTKDQIELLSSTTFKWLGRSDYLINSGGHKVRPEEIESTLISNGLQPPFFIYGKKDATLGEKVILVTEEEIEGSRFPEYFQSIHPFAIPKEHYILKNFILTPSGKIKRGVTFDQAEYKQTITFEK